MTIAATAQWHDDEVSALSVRKNGRMASYPHVSLIVIDHNGKSKLKGLLDDCMTSLIKTDYPDFEIIFVDNASNDGTTDHVERKFGGFNVRTLRLPSNMGYAGAANIALRHTAGRLVGILNNDITIINTAWLRTLVDFMLSTPSVAIASPALLWDETRIDSLGGEVNVLMVAWDAHSREEFALKNDGPIFTLSPPGAALLFRREIAEAFQNEIFDPTYFAYYEDVCLGLKANLIGQRVAVVPSSYIVHKRGSSWGLFSPQKFFYMRRNSIWTGITVFKTSQVLLLLPIWLQSTFYGSLVYHRITHNPKFFFASLRVVCSVLANFRKAWIAHEDFQARKTSVPESLDFSNSLILDSDKMTFFRRFALAAINLAIRLAGLSKFKITRLKQYPLVDPAYVSTNR